MTDFRSEVIDAANFTKIPATDSLINTPPPGRAPLGLGGGRSLAGGRSLGGGGGCPRCFSLVEKHSLNATDAGAYCRPFFRPRHCNCAPLALTLCW